MILRRAQQQGCHKRCGKAAPTRVPGAEFNAAEGDTEGLMPSVPIVTQYVVSSFFYKGS